MGGTSQEMSGKSSRGSWAAGTLVRLEKDQDGAVPGQGWVEIHFLGMRMALKQLDRIPHAVLWGQGTDEEQRQLGRFQFPYPGKSRPVSNLALTQAEQALFAQ